MAKTLFWLVPCPGPRLMELLDSEQPTPLIAQDQWHGAIQGTFCSQRRERGHALVLTPSYPDSRRVINI